MNNKEYARILKEIAILRRIRGDNHFKIRAYDNGGRTVENLSEDVDTLIEAGELEGVDGIGKSLARELRSIHDTGVSPTHTELLQELDPGLLDVMRVQGLGPKRIKLLYDTLGVCSIDTLREAAESGRVAELDGLGQKTQDSILKEIERLEASGGRTPLPAARAHARSVASALTELSVVEKIEVAGSIRRGRETIGDIDIVVATSDFEDRDAIFDHFVALPQVGDVLVRGDTKTSARLRSGIQVDVRVVEPHQFGATLHYFTGSKEHHIKLRTRAKKRGLKINEYGVFRRDDDSRIASATEEEIYAALDLQFIAPELRQGGREIELAEQGSLPDLVDASCVLGDIHMHTTETDGRNSIEEMVDAAIARGYAYIAITDHSQAVTVANGMTADRFRAHIEQVRQVDASRDEFRVLSGIEVDILKDGSLDMDHDLLEACDWVVGSVHSHFKLDEEAMTERLIRAIETGLLSCLGHPTGRILGGRGGYVFDADRVMEAAARHNVALEINGSPGRLDLNSEWAQKAVARGCRIVLSSDAHSTSGLEDIEFAIQQARRAGLTRAQVINTSDADTLVSLRSSS